MSEVSFFVENAACLLFSVIVQNISNFYLKKLIDLDIKAETRMKVVSWKSAVRADVVLD